jgi:hypothetical protein
LVKNKNSQGRAAIFQSFHPYANNMGSTDSTHALISPLFIAVQSVSMVQMVWKNGNLTFPDAVFFAMATERLAH